MAEEAISTDSQSLILDYSAYELFLSFLKIVKCGRFQRVR
jgi:hypothetical protein